MLDSKKRKDLVNHLLGSSVSLANAKNISDWYLWEGEGHNDKYMVLLNAMSAWYLEDYAYAAKQYRYFLDHLSDYSPSDVDIERMQTRLKEFEEKEKIAPKLECDDQRLKPIFSRLLYVFHDVNKPVHIFVAKDEQDYIAFHQKQFKEEVYPYKSFEAVGLYGDPNAYWLVFKSSVNDLLDDTALLGLCAHEIAHLDMYSKGNDEFDNNKQTDIYVMEHGFAYSLYRERLASGAAGSVLNADYIKDYILKIEQTEIR